MYLAIILLVGFLYFVYEKFIYRNASAYKDIPGPAPKPFFGNVLEMMDDPLKTFHDYSKKYPDVFLYWFFNQPVLVVSDPDSVKHVLSTNVKNYDKYQEEIILNVIGNGLLLANGDLWKRQRKLMTPAFGYAYMKTMVPSFVEITQVLIEKWSNISSSTVVNVHTDITELTLDVIGLVGFGYHFNAQTDPNAILPKAVTTILYETEVRVFQFFPTWKLPFTASSRRFSQAKDVLLREIESMIKERRSKGVSSEDNDLLGRLLAAEDPETKETISDSQLRDELITFLIAGHETTAAMICFCFYVLATLPDVEQKLKEEIESNLNGNAPTFEDFENLHYLDLVIKETMRLYPSVSMQTTRTAVESDKIGKYTVPKGTNLEVWPWIIHRSEKYWDNPLEFRPERHLDRQDRSVFSYIPFGAGGRECIGKRLALFEAKVVITMVMQNFSLRLAPGCTPKPVLRVTLRPDSLMMNINKTQ